MIQDQETVHLIEVVVASIGTAAVTIGGLLGVQKIRAGSKSSSDGERLTKTHVENLMLKHNEKVAQRYENLTAAVVKAGEDSRKVMREGFKSLHDRWDRLEARLDKKE